MRLENITLLFFAVENKKKKGRRKNWLFAGSDAGAERAAIIYSLVASCKLCEIDPFEYLRDVLDRVSTHPAIRIAELTPSGWKVHFAVPT